MQSLERWIEEAEGIEARHPGAAGHLVASLRQNRQALQGMLERRF